jgi:PAS domain-containing protein
MFTRQIAYQILFWTFVVIIAGHLFCPVLKVDEHWVHWITLGLSVVGLAVVVWLRGWIHATEVGCTIDPVLQKLLVVRMNPARIALLDESGKIIECSGPFAQEVGARSSYDLVGMNASEFLDEPEAQGPGLLRTALDDITKRPISFLGLDSLQRQAFLRLVKLNDEYLLSIDPIKG